MMQNVNPSKSVSESVVSLNPDVFDAHHLPICVQGARVHNLKNVSLAIPWNRLTVITGPSGSGKSSLAFDTIYAEGQRQYIESLSVYSRQFLYQLERPDVDYIKGLQPTISIDQRCSIQNPRSTVATLTEIYDYLRLLYSRVGLAHCYQCGRPIRQQSPEQIAEEILNLPANVRLMILAPVVTGLKGSHKDVLRKAIKSGFVRARIDGSFVELAQIPNLDPQKSHSIEIIIDRLILKEGIQSRLLESIKTALQNSEGLVCCLYEKERQITSEGTTRSVWKDILYSAHYNCPKCHINYFELEPRTFSFNSPYGICPQCQGLGKQEAFDPELMIPDASLSLNDGMLAILKGGAVTTSKLLQKEIDAFVQFWKLDKNLPFVKWDNKLKNRFLYGDLNSINFSKHQTKSTSSEKAIGSEKKSVNAGKNNSTLNDAKEHSSNITQDDKALLSLIKEARQQKEIDQVSNETKREKGFPIKESVIEFYRGFVGIISFFDKIYAKTKSKKEKAFLETFRGIVVCQSCFGSRIRPESRSVTVNGKKIYELTALPISESLQWFKEISLPTEQRIIAKPLIDQIIERLDFMDHIGLDYLTLDRPSDSLSGGELQRVRLATGLGNGLTGVCYILDEPSIGLHPRDNQRLIDALRNLQKRGNTVIVVEHDETIMRNADWLIDLGPGAGVLGGQILAEGTPQQIEAEAKSLTGKYLSGIESISIPSKRRKIVKSKMLTLEGVQTNNLKDVSVHFPLGTFICVTGVSGSGKSSLLNETLVPALTKRLNNSSSVKPGPHKSLRGVNKIDKLIQIDQSSIGRTPRSNPATYTGLFDEIRKLFASSRDARRRGYKTGRFSFNVPGGRCDHCQGQGIQKIEMHFLPDMYAVCPVCQGKRFNNQTLEIKYKDKSIADVLDMSIDEAALFFDHYPPIFRMLESLQQVGLGYMTLGQSSTTLSGGEAQRIKLAAELARVETGNTLYVLDEPTCGLHSEDIRKLLDVLSHLVDLGNTVIVIEHNLDVIKTADWIIDLGPEGGKNGGFITAFGTPEEIAKLDDNYTGQFLKVVLNKKQQ
ncbi:MAG: excinuclease ABC subunit UvrA [Planctomycetia bacterium]|nr:excinuclease ABC subunit UvrA [Planctomycetia bacterium]